VRTRLLVAVAAITALAAVAAGVLMTSGDRSRSGSESAPSSTDPDASELRTYSAPEAGQAFLDGYVDGDGRVVRRDQGGDTVSEGQGYALLLAVVADDRDRFEAVWRWTRTHLRRADGLLSWWWADGAVRDRSSAADADLDVAHALVLGGDHFEVPEWRRDGVALGRAVLDTETATTRLGRVLLAGSWVEGPPYRVDPSYASPVAFAVLAEASGDDRWNELAAGSRALLHALLARAPLPPDWAEVSARGAVAPVKPPDGSPIGFGLDAARVPIRYAASCDPEDLRLAARLAPALLRSPDEIRAVTDLRGRPIVTWSHPLPIVAAAAAAAADGRTEQARFLQASARDLSRRVDTYYGSAWAALATTVFLPGCAPAS
jgi:endoglucanase